MWSEVVKPVNQAALTNELDLIRQCGALLGLSLQQAVHRLHPPLLLMLCRSTLLSSEWTKRQWFSSRKPTVFCSFDVSCGCFLVARLLLVRHMQYIFSYIDYLRIHPLYARRRKHTAKSDRFWIFCHVNESAVDLKIPIFLWYDWYPCPGDLIQLCYYATARISSISGCLSHWVAHRPNQCGFLGTFSAKERICCSVFVARVLRKTRIQVVSPSPLCLLCFAVNRRCARVWHCVCVALRYWFVCCNGDRSAIAFMQQVDHAEALGGGTTYCVQPLSASSAQV